MWEGVRSPALPIYAVNVTTLSDPITRSEHRQELKSAYVKKGFQFNTDTGCVTDFATKMNTFTTATTEQTALTSTQFIESTVTTNDRPPHTQDKIDKCNVQIKFEK